MQRNVLCGMVLAGIISWATTAVGQEPEITELEEPGWWGVVIADGPTQDAISRIDIRERPYRPFHFYGNTVRRMYYRGNPMPTWDDVRNSWQALLEENLPPSRPTLHPAAADQLPPAFEE